MIFDWCDYSRHCAIPGLIYARVNFQDDFEKYTRVRGSSCPSKKWIYSQHLTANPRY